MPTNRNSQTRRQRRCSCSGKLLFHKNAFIGFLQAHCAVRLIADLNFAVKHTLVLHDDHRTANCKHICIALFGLAQLQLRCISIQSGAPVFVPPSLLSITPRRIHAAVKAAEISTRRYHPLVPISTGSATFVLSLQRCAWTSIP